MVAAGPLGRAAAAAVHTGKILAMTASAGKSDVLHAQCNHTGERCGITAVLAQPHCLTPGATQRCTCMVVAGAIVNWWLQSSCLLIQ